MDKILLISNEVMHYRVSVYNYFYRRFKQDGREFVVRANRLQKENRIPVEFDFSEIPFSFPKYAREIKRINPKVIILFLHLKELILWPLIHWIKTQKVPVVFWTKGVNLDDVGNSIRNRFFYYIHSISDALILYSSHEMNLIRPKNRGKVFIANNTINFDDIPAVEETREEIKAEFGVPFEKVVLFVGRMDVGGGRKKVDHLIRIFRDINTPGTGLVIAGAGLNDDLLRTANKKNTIYLGEIHDPANLLINKIFKMADVFSIPGHVGLGLNQAMFWGLPVVTEEGLQPPEIHYLINGRNGFIVPRDDIEELKNKILYLLENDEERRGLGDNARRDILQYASTKGMYQGFKDCVDYLTEEK